MSVQPRTAYAGGGNQANHGFTLIELLIVLVLLSIMLAVSVPRFRATVLNDPLKQAARQVIALFQKAREQAVYSKQGCLLEADLDARTMHLFCQNPGVDNDNDTDAVVGITLPESVRIDSIYRGEGDRSGDGLVVLQINRSGLPEPSLINLKRGDAVISLEVSPFFPRILLGDHLLVPEQSRGWRP